MNLLDIKGNILPLTEDNAELVGFTASGKKILGEEQITKCASKISHIGYNKEIKITNKKEIIIRYTIFTSYKNF